LPFGFHASEVGWDLIMFFLCGEMGGSICIVCISPTVLDCTVQCCIKSNLYATQTKPSLINPTWVWVMVCSLAFWYLGIPFAFCHSTLYYSPTL
jgi:hypothetical protein